MASTKQINERLKNIAAITAYVRGEGRATRMEISSALSLSWACVSDLTAHLIASGILSEQRRSERDGAEAKGRTPTYLTLAEDKYFLGVDINDSGIAICALGINGKILRTRRWDAERLDDMDALRHSVREKVDKMMGEGECLGIGIAMEGERAQNGSFAYPLSSGVAEVAPEHFLLDLGLPITVRHDPECMLYAAADASDTDCMAVRVDTGVGVAAMKNGRILDLPLELGFTRRDGRLLRHILKDCRRTGDYNEISIALGEAVGNLALLLGVKKVFIVGEIIEWLGSVREGFDTAFCTVARSIKYEISTIEDASVGAARLAMADYPCGRSE